MNKISPADVFKDFRLEFKLEGVTEKYADMVAQDVEYFLRSQYDEDIVQVLVHQVGIHDR